MTLHARPRSNAPSSVRTAVALTYAYIGLMLLTLILTIALKSQLVDSWAEGRSDAASPELIAAAAPAFVPVAIGQFILWSVIFGISGVFIGRGANWARILLSIFAGLGILAVLLAFIQRQPVYFVTLNLVGVVILGALLFFLYRRDSNQFFSRGLMM